MQARNPAALPCILRHMVPPPGRSYAVLKKNEALEPIFLALDREPAWVGRRFGNKQPHGVPRFLYKFRSIRAAERCGAESCKVDPQVATPPSVDRCRDMVVRSELWLSCAADFNDPFDVSAHIVARGDVETRRRRIADLVKKHDPSLTWKQREKKIAELMQRPMDVLREGFRESMANLRNTMGVCSFAGSVRSILMWSHYASEHAGVCLVFRPMSDYRVFAHAQPVEYSDEYPELNCGSAR